MKTYKEYGKITLGYSDIASLTLVGIKGKKELTSEILQFGSDGNYSAYIVPENTEIPEHYKEISAFTDWLRIYDDDSKVADLSADEIKIFRAGNFGMIIQIINPKYDTAEWVKGQW